MYLRRKWGNRHHVEAVSHPPLIVAGSSRRICAALCKSEFALPALPTPSVSIDVFMLKPSNSILPSLTLQVRRAGYVCICYFAFYIPYTAGLSLPVPKRRVPEEGQYASSGGIMCERVEYGKDNPAAGRHHLSHGCGDFGWREDKRISKGPVDHRN